MVCFGGFFAKLGHFAGFSLRMYHLYHWKDQSRCERQGHQLFSLAGPVKLQIKASVIQWKDIRPWQPEFEHGEKHFVSENFAEFSLCILSEGSAKLRWVGRRVRRNSVGCSVAQKGAA